MSNNQKNSFTLLEDGKIQKELSKRFGLKRYWTFQEGINFFLPVEYRNSFPLSVIINDYLFDCMKQDVEPEGDTKVQRLKTFNSVKDAEQIVADINRKAQWSRSKKGRKLSFNEIQEEKRKYFCSKIKIKPEILICYIIDHIDLFSSEIEIPEGIKRILNKTNETLEQKLNNLIQEVGLEIDLLYDEMKKVAKDNDRQVLCLEYKDGIEAFNRKHEITKRIKSNDIKKEHFGGEKPARDIKGGILKRVVLREMPNLSSDRENIKIDAQALYKRMTTIKRTS